MRPKPFPFLVTLLGTVCFLSACASFRADTLPRPADWPPEARADRKSISLVITGEGSVNGQPVDLPSAAMQKWQEAIGKAYTDSGLFTEVKPGPADTDLRAEVHVVDRGEGSQAMAFISGFTMTLVPASGIDQFIVRTKIKDRNGQTLGTYEKSETVSFWMQFFLIFVMPFNWPPTVAMDALYDINRAAIVEAHEEGVI